MKPLDKIENYEIQPPKGRKKKEFYHGWHMPKTISVSKFMEIVKSNSSKWVHATFPEKSNFRWQAGYGAFSVSKSAEDAVIQYIRDQQEHHRKKSFQEEFIDFLNKYGIGYDENYIWK